MDIALGSGGFCKVSDIDWMWLVAYGWSKNGDGYIQARIDGKVVHMHKLIAKRMGWPVSERVDHKDQDKTNNQRDNLRQATQSQNLANRGPNSNNTSGHKGVFWDTARNKWRAEVAGKSKRFDDFGEACQWQRDESKRKYGEFAV